MDYVIVDSAQKNILFGPQDERSCDFEFRWGNHKGRYNNAEMLPISDPSIIGLVIAKMFQMIKEIRDGLDGHNLI